MNKVVECIVETAPPLFEGNRYTVKDERIEGATFVYEFEEIEGSFAACYFTEVEQREEETELIECEALIYRTADETRNIEVYLKNERIHLVDLVIIWKTRTDNYPGQHQIQVKGYLDSDPEKLRTFYGDYVTNTFCEEVVCDEPDKDSNERDN